MGVRQISVVPPEQWLELGPEQWLVLGPEQWLGLGSEQWPRLGSGQWLGSEQWPRLGSGQWLGSEQWLDPHTEFGAVVKAPWSYVCHQLGNVFFLVTLAFLDISSKKMCL